MKKIISFLVIAMVFFKANSQAIIDTFPAAVGSTKQFTISSNIQGVMTNGDPYVVGFNVNYPEPSKPIEVVRIDILTQQVVTKRIDSSQYYAGQLWASTYDSTGTVYISAIYGPGAGHVYRLDLKDPDTIGLHDLGAPFSGTTVYSMALGRDGKIYMGEEGDSKPGFYDPVTKTFTTYSTINYLENYILSVTGDTDWVYSQVGQTDSIFLYATRKSDGVHFELSSNPVSTRYNLTTEKGYCMVQQDYAGGGLPAGFYYLYGGAMHTTQPPWTVGDPTAGDQINYYEIYNTPVAGYYYNTSIYDPITNYVFMTHGFGTGSATIDSVVVPADSLLLTISGPIFTIDDTTIYYKANIQYGPEYSYNIYTGVVHPLGNTPTNLYSALIDNRPGHKGVYLGGYPSGAVMYYDFTQPWTTDKLIQAQVVPLTTSSNPSLITYFKTSSTPPAGFHHTYTLNYDYSDTIIVATGEVIRIANTIGLGCYNVNQNLALGIDYTIRPNLLYDGGLASYKKWTLMTSGSADTTVEKPFIFFYNAQNNTIEDSINIPGFTDYGNIFVVGDNLYGINSTKEYKMNLLTRKIIDTVSYQNQSGYYILSDGRLLGSGIPRSFYPYQATFQDISIGYEHNGIIYGVNSVGQLVRVRNYIKKNNTNSAIGRYLYLKK